MNDVILIGNGPSVKKHEFGKLIDSYKTVVRFNWYHIDGYEKYVGTKTDIWITSVFDPVRAKKEYDLVVEHSWEWAARNDTTYQKFYAAKIPAAKTFAKLTFDMKQYMGLRLGLRRTAMVDERSYQIWSTGAIAAWWLLKNELHSYSGKTLSENNRKMPSFDKIDMYGFDWWDMESNDNHHYGDSQTVGKNHKPKVELVFFRFLWEEGLIHDLNPESDFHNAPRPND